MELPSFPLPRHHFRENPPVNFMAEIGFLLNMSAFVTFSYGSYWQNAGMTKQQNSSSASIPSATQFAFFLKKTRKTDLQ